MTTNQHASMRVLMLTDVYFPRINGVSTSIETFRRDLEHCGIDATLVAPEYPEHHAATNIHRVPSWRLPFDPEDRLMSWPALQKAVHQLSLRHFDLVHIQTPFAAHFAGVRFGRHFGVPVIATYHTHFEEYLHHYLPLMPRSWLRATARQIVRSQCNTYDAIIVPSVAMLNTLSGYGVSKPLHILPTGIPVDQFANGDRCAFRIHHNIAPERQVALCVGRVAHEKNLGFLLEVTERIRHVKPDFLLLIAGDGPARLDLQHQAQVLGIEDNVHFVGYLDRHKELADCYAAADLFVFSSKTETQGLVLLEAMAAGLPVYALAELGTRDILEPRRGAVVAPDDVAAFTAGLADLLGDAPRRSEMSAKARTWAAEWSAPERAQQLARLYRSLTAARQPSQRFAVESPA